VTRGRHGFIGRFQRMGPLLSLSKGRNFAVDAHDCIMVQVSGPAEYKCVGARLARHKRVPLGWSDRSAVPNEIPMMARPLGIASRHKIQADPALACLPGDLIIWDCGSSTGAHSRRRRWTEDADASRRARMRARFAADGLDPSASSVRVAHQKHRRKAPTRKKGDHHRDPT
jgi:hypothetical protein